MTGSFDPQLNLIYWGVGNPGPDWNGEVREGDNLYSDCVVAVDADSGQIKWHFQFTPHDVHDWDACQIPVLVDLLYKGRARKLMLWGNRNAFYYILDRETGEFLHAAAFADQTWAKEIDPQGRPVRVPGKLPTLEGNYVRPDVTGAANWWSPTYSPKTNLFYLMAYDGGARYYINRDVEFTPGLPFLGGFGLASRESRDFPGPEVVSAVRALDPLTGERKWEYRVPPKSTSGLVSTAGDLVFGGSRRGHFYALDARTGKELWRIDLGGNVHAAPITYLADGQQFITIASGNAFFTFGL
jgi:alcohol dehydrogenase (cytochrome c)